MSALTTILIGAAAKVGAPIVKSILEDRIGGAAGELGGVIIDAIAGKAGVSVDELERLPATKQEEAIKAVEEQSPEIIAAWTAQQREANRLMLEEMKKETPFGWLWRPAGMWLLHGLLAWLVVVRPLINAVMEALGARAGIEMGMDLGTFTAIYTIYIGLYMGGNTVIRATSARKDA